jgi:hypothetical protein
MPEFLRRKNSGTPIDLNPGFSLKIQGIKWTVPAHFVIILGQVWDASQNRFGMNLRTVPNIN